MKVMVVGGGGREHAIIKKIKESPKVDEIYALPGNGGIAEDATCVGIGAEDLPGIVKFATENAIDFAIVAPDDPLVMGCVDLLQAEGIPCFGPNRDAAIIEGSKAFSKDLMKKYGIPTAQYEIFTEMDDALAYVEDLQYPGCSQGGRSGKGKGRSHLRDQRRRRTGGQNHDGGQSSARAETQSSSKSSWKGRRSPCFPLRTAKS